MTPDENTEAERRSPGRIESGLRRAVSWFWNHNLTRRARSLALQALNSRPVSFVRRIARNEAIDAFFGRFAYRIVIVFGVFGTLFTLGKSAVPATIIFLGTILVAALAMWRARQFENQVQENRFERAIEMAADYEKETRSVLGLSLLGEMIPRMSAGQLDASLTIASQTMRVTQEQVKAFTNLNHDFRDMIGKLEEVPTNERGYVSEREKGEFTRKTYDIFVSFCQKDLPKISFPSRTPYIRNNAIRLWHASVSRKIKRDLESNALVCFHDELGSSGNCHLDMTSVKKNNTRFLVYDPKARDVIPPNDKTMGDCTNALFVASATPEATFDYLDLSRSTFLLSNVAGSSFKGANLYHATFFHVNITGVDFSGVKNLSLFELNFCYWIKPPEGREDLLRLARPTFSEESGITADRINCLSAGEAESMRVDFMKWIARYNR